MGRDLEEPGNKTELGDNLAGIYKSLAIIKLRLVESKVSITRLKSIDENVLE